MNNAGYKPHWIDCCIFLFFIFLSFTVKNFYNEIKMIKQPTDLIYLDSELDYHLAQYYFGIKEKIYIYNKTYAGIPQYVGKVLISEDAVTQILPSYPIRAFVVYYHWYNIRSIE